MEARARSIATLGVLSLLLVIGGVWGWSALTEPLPEEASTAVCEDREFGRGDRITRRDVTVSVYNAGTRVGLAGLTMNLLTDAGFAAGSEGNAPDRASVARVQIWTEEPKNPAVDLVASHFGQDVRVVRRSSPGAGIAVVVGDDFESLTAGQRAVVARQATSVCGPPRA
ncbi:LytR C-terminal domain-containing protein [Nocardioides euryhalodurans]|uniref:LytR family transcriptional regulator n=1 Tax=Nocardioides euryhalodurans TaxID=2518370 RepID=A0A4P7GLH6_9ACTN|nr:LytR C-terminal domain-containing protein [Nocardioides euryhalodurans]QBR92664.1 LytR family transcriptional regulator [Nocardioides euryhalodurans]